MDNTRELLDADYWKEKWNQAEKDWAAEKVRADALETTASAQAERAAVLEGLLTEIKAQGLVNYPAKSDGGEPFISLPMEVARQIDTALQRGQGEV